MVVELGAPGLAAGGKAHAVAAQQLALERRIRDVVPSAQVRWRYRVVLNGLAVVLPERAVPRLEHLSGVREVYPSVRFGPALDRSVAAIKAPALWGPLLATSGQGVKIGILDDGVDRTHPFFNPAGYVAPAGFPKGQAAYTTAKVIVARSFPPPSPSARYSNLPFDPELSAHGTHVAGIAAGNDGTQASIGGGRVTLSGVAPRAYLGNYRVLTIPTVSNVGLNGNSPEIAAGIEAAVRDGMDVINLSLGEPEIAPGRDLVVRAIEGAAAAGVVPVIAGGNDFGTFGNGSISSPGSAQSAITAAASDVDARLSGFSSAGPTPISLRLKPDVTAPGVGILSSVPVRDGTWQALSGTSMAAPHIAGAAALLTQRHPTWSVAQVKSALALTARPAFDRGAEARTTRQGAGFVDLERADQPLIFAQGVSLSFGLMKRRGGATRRVSLTDAGGGVGEWTVSISRQTRSSGVAITAPTRVTVPGTLSLRASVRGSAAQGETTGFVVLSRAGQTRRLPYWLRVTAPRLSRLPARVLRRSGVYRGNTRGRRALVTVYRYPENPTAVGVEGRLRGPEQAFRIRIRRPVANFGAAILGRSRVQPRIVMGTDENHQAGSPALPLSVNPYLPSFFERAPVSAVNRPAPGVYTLIFDSPSRAGAGRFRFRFWIDDLTPPTVRLETASVRGGGTLIASAFDRGAGVDPRGVYARIDGRPAGAVSVSGGRIRIRIGSLARGRHRLELQVSDHQEVKNMENVTRILPNTRVLATSFSVR